MNNAKRTVYFYRKRDCHLCEDMARELNDFRHELGNNDDTFAIVERDIDEDEKWYARYREYVPTLVLEQEEICHYFFDRDELINALAKRNSM